MVYINRTPEELAYLDSMEDSATDRPDSPPPPSRGDVRRPISARSKGGISDECSLFTSNDFASKRGRQIWEGGPVSEDRYLRMQAEVFRLKVEINKKEDQHKQLLVRLAHAEDTVKRRMRDDIQQNCIPSKAKSSAMGRVAQQYVANEKVRDLEQKLRELERELQKKREHIRYYRDQNLALKKQLEETMRANWSARPSSAPRMRDGHMVQRLKEQLMELRTENFKLKAKLSQHERPQTVQSGMTVQSNIDDAFPDSATLSNKQQEVKINAMYSIQRIDKQNENHYGCHKDDTYDVYKNQDHPQEVAENLVENISELDVKNQLLASWAKMDNLNILYQKSMEELNSLKVNHERALLKLQETNMDCNDLNFSYKDAIRPEGAQYSATTSSKSNLSTPKSPKSALSTPKSGSSKVRHMLSHQRKYWEQSNTPLLQQEGEDRSLPKDDVIPMEVDETKNKTKAHVNKRSLSKDASTTPPKKEMTTKQKDDSKSERKKSTLPISSQMSENHATGEGQSSQCKRLSFTTETSVLSNQDELKTNDLEQRTCVEDKVQEDTKLNHDVHFEKDLPLESDRTLESCRTLESDRTLESERTCERTNIEDECGTVKEEQDIISVKKLESTIAMEPTADHAPLKDVHIVLSIRCLQLEAEFVDPCVQNVYVQFDFLGRFCNKVDQCTPSVENIQSTIFYSYTRAFAVDKENHYEAREALKTILESEYSAFLHFQIMGKNDTLDQQYKIGTCEINLLRLIVEANSKDELSLELDVKSLIDKSQCIGKFFVILQGLQLLRSLDKEVFHGQRKTIMCI